MAILSISILINVKHMPQKTGRPRKREQEVKQRTFWLTDDAIAFLDQLATYFGWSRSELMEQFARSPQKKVIKLLEKDNLPPGV
jgi:hypothetical protein